MVAVTGATAEEIGTRAAAAGLVLYEFTPQSETVEQIVMHLTEDAVGTTAPRPRGQRDGTTAPPRPTTQVDAPAARLAVTQPRVVRAEWIKLRSAFAQGLEAH